MMMPVGWGVEGRFREPRAECRRSLAKGDRSIRRMEARGEELDEVEDGERVVGGRVDI